MTDPSSNRPGDGGTGASTDGAPRRLFVSYSHRDGELVDPVVSLLRTVHGDVFQDVVSIQPGKRWKDELERALSGADLVVVFWCAHSRDSDWVHREYSAAIERNKDVLPLFIDGTARPGPLDEFQGIDFTAVFGPAHAALEKRRVPAPRAVLRFLRLVAATLCAWVVGVLVLGQVPGGPKGVTVPGTRWVRIPWSTPPLDSGPSWVGQIITPQVLGWTLVILLALAAVTLALLPAARRAAARVRALGPSRQDVEEIARRVADRATG